MSLCGRALGIRAAGRWLIADIDVEVVPGEILVVLGPNGAGKSTLLGALAGDRAVDAGEVRLDGQALASLPLTALAERRSVVGPPANLAFDYTVADIVAMGWRHGERFGGTIRDEALAAVLGACGLTGFVDRIYMTLSSGERQRVQFARGLLQIWRPPDDAAPRWMLLDEPTANLDIAHGIALLTALREHARQGVGVLAILHDLNLGARFADRVLLLDAGRTAAAGRPAEVMTSGTLTDVYRTPVHVEHNSHLKRLTVLT